MELENIDVRYFVDQNLILNNTDIFITHGGLNSVSESVCSLVPMVVIPLVGDQHSIAKSLEVRGSGVIINRNEIKENILLPINLIFDNWEQYQENISIIRDSFIDFSVADNTVGEINNIIGENDLKVEL